VKDYIIYLIGKLNSLETSFAKKLFCKHDLSLFLPSEATPMCWWLDILTSSVDILQLHIKIVSQYENGQESELMHHKKHKIRTRKAKQLPHIDTNKIW